MTTEATNPLAQTQLPTVVFSKGSYRNRFGGTTEFNRHGRMEVFQATYDADSGWSFRGKVLDDEWRTALRINADPDSNRIARVQQSAILSQDIDALVMEVSNCAKTMTTADGYRFTIKTESGMWTDTDLALGPDVRDYEAVEATLVIETSSAVQSAGLADRIAPSADEVLEIATMQALGWNLADGYTKDHIEGARYQRRFGGGDSPFAAYEMTIAQTELGWIPMHGCVKMPAVKSPTEAALVLTQYWLDLPSAEKVTYQYTQSLRQQ